MKGSFFSFFLPSSDYIWWLQCPAPFPPSQYFFLLIWVIESQFVNLLNEHIRLDFIKNWYADVSPF